MSAYTGITLRDAILLAADHIEQHPKEFAFQSIIIPDGCGTPGCALGWIGHFLGLRADYQDSQSHYPGDVKAVSRLMGLPMVAHENTEFYRRLFDIDTGWLLNARDCAAALRLYADKYHPGETLASWADCAWQPMEVA